VGDSLVVGDQQVQVVGIVADASYQGLPTVWTPLNRYQQMRTDVRPETVGAKPTTSVVALTLDPSVTPEQLDMPDGYAALGNEETYLSIPGIKEQKASLNAIVSASLVVGGLVVALFFALVVLEKRELFASLKALGASSARLGSGVVFQAFGATITAVIVGALVARALGYALPDDIPFLFRPQTLMVSGTLTVLAGVVGALFSLRRISRIDPATALGGAL
jgi:putative ABC transport system permease protein